MEKAKSAASNGGPRKCRNPQRGARRPPSPTAAAPWPRLVPPERLHPPCCCPQLHHRAV